MTGTPRKPPSRWTDASVSMGEKLQDNLTATAITEDARSFTADCESIPDLTDAVQALARQADAGLLAAFAAHEINNLLTPLISYAEMARDDPKYTEKALHYAIEHGKRIGRLAHSIMGCVEPQNEPNAESCHPEAVAHRVLDSLGMNDEHEDAPHPIRVHLDLQPAQLAGDPTVLEHVLLNLVSNARRVMANQKSASLILQGRNASEHYELTVSDNGPGVPREMIPSLFDAGVSGEVGRSGLGLSIVRDLVTQQGGAIRYAGNLADGATFVVAWPRLAA